MFSQYRNIFKKFGIVYLCVSFLNGILLTVDAASNDTAVYNYMEPINLHSSDCKIIEPMYQQMFDLNPLRSELGHKLQGNTNDTIEFNICGNLMKRCDSKSEVAACLTRNGKEYVLGTNSDIILNNGRLGFNMTGGKCNEESSFSLEIRLYCDYNSVSNPIHLQLYPDNSCSFVISVSTPLACLPLSDDIKNKKCTAKDDKTGRIFDLTQLSRGSNVPVRDHNGSIFIINVCKPVKYGPHQMCPPNSSICRQEKIKPFKQPKYINYGSTNAMPIFADGKLNMHFESTEKCNSTHNYTSNIYFRCDESLREFPEYIGKRDCQHEFTWSTPIVCPPSECTTFNSINKKVYNLTSLADKQYTVKNGNVTYSFGICRQAKEPCSDNSGACGTINGQLMSMGEFNNNLMFNQTGSPYLVYKTGSACNGTETKWSTRIEFLCKSENMQEGPVIIENSNCELVIQYVTELVCHYGISCQALNKTDNNLIDLTPLIRSNENYLASVSNELKKTEGPPILYYLNVCRPLVPQFGLSCASSSAGCRAKLVNDTPRNEENLGFPDVSLMVLHTKRGSTAQLKYLRGSVCSSDNATDLSSVIDFYCDSKAGHGNPVLAEINHGCEYVFEWPTNIICPVKPILYNANKCEIFNDDTNVTIDLKEITDGSQGTFNISPTLSELSTLNLCHQNQSVEINYAQSSVNIFLETKGPCLKNGLMIVEVRFICSAIESIKLSFDPELCNLFIAKKTKKICAFIGNKVPTTDSEIKQVNNNSSTDQSNTSETNIPDTAGGGGFSTLGIILVISMFLGCVIMTFITLFRNPERRARIMSICQRSSSIIQYRRVQADDEEVNLLLPDSARLSDSDDELLT